ncbi:hypothetical protein GP486_006383 [Trichoglossum hirsutum]|uniref:NAD(P)-binding protein n=1 Tax=Trichoglossum hirsutum TaxID=265104 RepID=A0A9P8IJ61_9PEZI|nr:hypothetical protein GP486_006383 [Trichoglossum hirsutum]
MSTAPFPSPTKTWHTTTYASIDPELPQLSAKGKFVVVTGGGSGVGPAIVRAFARAGAVHIGILGRTKASLVATKRSIESEFPNVAIHVAVADISSESAVNTAFSTFRSLSGGRPVDIFVNNAAYLPDPTPAKDASVDEWWRGYEVNVKGSLILTQAFLNTAVSKDAVLINVSTAGVHVPVQYLPGLSSYSSSKLAAVKLFDYIQQENPGIRVISVHPGVIATEMNTKSAAGGVRLSFDDGEFLKGKLVWSNWDVDELKAKAEEVKNSSMLTINLDGWMG